MSLNNIKVISLNTHGFKGNVVYVNNIVKNNDIIFISEHWISKLELFLLEDISSSHSLIFHEAQKNGTGRPFGGNCFFIRKNLPNDIEIIHDEHNILAIKVKFQNKLYIFIGVYLPACRNDTKSLENYKLSLASIKSILNQYSDEGEIILLGDFQSFPNEIYEHHSRSHESRNSFSPILQTFLIENELILLDVENGFGPNYTYNHATLDHQSYIDHIAVYNHSELCKEQCNILIDDTNTSDHMSITTSFNANTKSNLEHTSDPYEHKNHVPNVLWKNKIFLKLYQNELNDILQEKTSHKLNVNADINFLNQSLLTAAKSAQNKFNNQNHTARYKKRKHWWNDDLSHHKNILAEAFKTWRVSQFDRSEHNISYARYKLARKNFRNAIKLAQNRKLANHYVNLDQLKSTKSDQFWKQLRLSKKKDSARLFTINNKNNKPDIVDEFESHFDKLLNTPRINIQNKHVDPTTLPLHHTETIIFSQENVITAIKSLPITQENH